MATKAELIGQTLLKLGGGVITADLSTRWGEAAVYLAVAVNYVMTGNYWADSQKEGERTVNPMLMAEFVLPVVYDEVRMMYRTDLTHKVITISKGRGIEVRLQNRRVCTPVTQGSSALADFYSQYKSEPSYEVGGPQLLWWHVIGPQVDNVHVRQLVHVNDLDEDEEVLLPSDGEAQVLDLMFQYLSGQKQIPSDKTQDGKDNN